MSYITDYQYYENNQTIPTDENWGSYQYVSLDDIVNNFMLMYQGNNELLNNINRYQVLFFAKRAIQELNYDAMKEIKILQLQICDQLRFVLPPDYVNWVRISCYKDGVLQQDWYYLSSTNTVYFEFEIEPNSIIKIGYNSYL